MLRANMNEVIFTNDDILRRKFLSKQSKIGLKLVCDRVGIKIAIVEDYLITGKWVASETAYRLLQMIIRDDSNFKVFKALSNCNKLDEYEG